jgi:hypothetical protein
MATTPKSRPTNTKSASRGRSASASRSTSNARRRPAAAKTLPTPEPSTASKLKAPLIAGGATIAAVAGGIVLGAKARPRRRSFPSLPSMPSMNGLDLKKVDMKKTRKQVGRASKQFGEFTRELRKAGEQAERIGDALS